MHVVLFLGFYLYTRSFCFLRIGYIKRAKIIFKPYNLYRQYLFNIFSIYTNYCLCPHWSSMSTMYFINLSQNVSHHLPAARYTIQWLIYLIFYVKFYCLFSAAFNSYVYYMIEFLSLFPDDLMKRPYILYVYIVSTYRNEWNIFVENFAVDIIITKYYILSSEKNKQTRVFVNQSILII